MAGIAWTLGLLTIGLTSGVVAFVVRELERAGPPRLGARELRERGARARACVVDAERLEVLSAGATTRCRLELVVTPADGGSRFVVEHTAIVPVDAVPSLGDVWPAWYLPEDRRQVLVVGPAAPSLVARPPVGVPAADRGRPGRDPADRRAA